MKIFYVSLPVISKKNQQGASEIHKIATINPVVGSSFLMAVAGMGDAFLYAYLPVEGAALGMSSLVVGVLLSINKFFRFFTNKLIAHAANLYGIKNILFLGTFLAALTNVMYAINWSIWFWILSRLIWGAAYSALRFSSTQYAGKSNHPGSGLGLSRSIQEVGPVLAYWISPVIISNYNIEITFSLMATATIALIPLICFFPDYKFPIQKIKKIKLELPGSMAIWIFSSSFIIEGLLVIGISRLIKFDHFDASQLLLMTAIFISSRRIFNIVLAPFSGLIIKKMGFKRLFDCSCYTIIIGLILICLDQPTFGLMIAYIGSAFNFTIIPLLAIQFGSGEENFEILTKINTSRDLGSAFGSLCGLIMFSFLNTVVLFTLLSILLMMFLYNVKKDNYQYE